MGWFEVTWSQRERRTTLVEAETPEHAQQMILVGDFEDSDFVDSRDIQIVVIDELD